MIADLAIAFVAGLLSCASACVLPLLPAYLAYLGGLSSPGPGARGRGDRLAVLGGAGLFVAGFGSAFVALGAGAALVGASLAGFRPVVVTASGVVLVALGTALLVSVPWLARDWRLHVAHRLPRSPLASYVVGVAFAVGWTPCVGPVLAAILVLAANTTSVARGAALLAAYSAGLGLPFLAAAAFVAPVTALLARVRGAYPALNAAAAVLLVGMGALTLANRLTVLNGLVPDLTVAAAPAGLSTPPPGQQPADRLVGRPAPAVTVADMAGRRLSLRELRGRPLVVNFWATWCVPCRQELPLFAAAERAHRAEGLTVVPIDYEESPEAVARFWRELGLDLTPYVDPDGAAARAFGVGLRQTGLPATVLVDRRGEARSLIPGQVDPRLFAARLAAILPP
jgi:cytochrome c-type biogenesis protein